MPSSGKEVLSLDVKESEDAQSVERNCQAFAFTVYDAPMLHHGLNIIVKHMAVL